MTAITLARRDDALRTVRNYRAWAIEACTADPAAWSHHFGEGFEEYLQRLDRLEAALNGGADACS